VSTRPVPISLSILLCAALHSSLAACGARSTQEGNAPAQPVELEPTSQTIFGQRLLLYLEHAHVVRGEGTRFLAHLSVLATGEPVRSGRVVLEIGDLRLAAEAPKRDGLFVPEGNPTAAGSFPARLVVESPQASETLELAPLIVHASLHEAQRAAEEAGEDPSGAVPFLMEQQWKVKLLVAEAEARTLTERLRVPAEVVTPEGAQASVAPAAAGRLLAPTAGRLPRTGERVAAGQVLALVEPPLGAPELAQLRTLELELELRALDIARSASEAAARLRFAEQERTRISGLRAQELASQQQMDQAERDLGVARGDDEAARAAKGALEALLARRGDEGRVPLRLPLVAPLTGVVVTVGHVEGESVVPEDEVFQLLDPARVWIEGRISEFDLARVGGLPEALATFAALPGKRLVLGAAAYLAPRLDPDSRTVRIRYEVEDASGDLRSGMLAELALATAGTEAVAIPRDALVHDQGLVVAYVMLEGELFQKRDLELGIEDGDWVEVRRGLAPGEHVATRGAYVVKLAALSPASFGAGHAH